MEEDAKRINQLLEKMESLLKRQETFSKEIIELREEIFKLKSIHSKSSMSEIVEPKLSEQASEKTIELKNETVIPVTSKSQNQQKKVIYEIPNEPKFKLGLEKFIGENLINKIGIIITIVGVAIGAKYSIEHQLISPSTRIILGYAMGLILLGLGFKLKKKYENYSSVLVSGAIAILYFITYATYSFYSLIPQVFAFVLMVVFTAFTVFTAINYNKQIIAHIGLVGAYAIPFLLSEGSGKVGNLFIYMAIINIGILLIALKKYWKQLYYSSFLITWLVFFGWYVTNYAVLIHFDLSLVFLFIFFVIFYLIFLGYKLIHNDKFESSDIILLLSNSFIFYGLGYSILISNSQSENLGGLFTIGNALIHFVVALVIYNKKWSDKNLFYLVSGLVLAFITIAIPVQLDGNWVTLLWVFEAVILFSIGRIKNVSIYEKLSYPLMLLAFFSIVHDWYNVYIDSIFDQSEIRISPFFNIHFLSSILFIGSFSIINFLNQKRKGNTNLFSQKTLNEFYSYSIPTILLLSIYLTFRLEISIYWDQLYLDSAIETLKNGKKSGFKIWDEDLIRLKSVWLINYSLLFFTILAFVNSKKIKNVNLAMINLGFSYFIILVFLTQGLFFLSDLRESYLDETLSKPYESSSINLSLRYISFVFVGTLLFSIYNYLKQDFLKSTASSLHVAFDSVLYISLIWIASSELIAWMDILDFKQSYKLGLSILWGTYALLIIAFGIWKNKKYLRIGAIGLFAATLIKLFLYDISHLDTIAKTIVFVSLGILLLIISFLYNKYKHLFD